MKSAQKFVSPWGVEPQSLEPESNILSIELRSHNASQISADRFIRGICALRCAKLIVYLYFCKSIVRFL